MLKALSKAIVTAQVHAGRFVWQIHSRLRIDLPGDFAHGVQRSVHLIQRLRLIPQPEATAACDPAQADIQNAAASTAARTELGGLFDVKPHGGKVRAVSLNFNLAADAGGRTIGLVRRAVER
jgi:hypothetical protein